MSARTANCYQETQAFYGAPFIWDYLGNFGGNTSLVGPINKINQRLTAAMNDTALTNFIGVGATLEGFNNPVVYEMLFRPRVGGRSFWISPTWVRDEACARAGGPDTNVEQAWAFFGQKILVDGANPIGGQGVIFQDRNPSLRGESNNMLSRAYPLSQRGSRPRVGAVFAGWHRRAEIQRLSTRPG